MVVAIFPSLEGENLEDVSIRLAERWRVGQKGLDSGVILVVFAKDRRVRLEVGYGLEGALPDAVAGQIIRDSIAPAFREGRYATGLERVINAVFARIDATPAGERARRREPVLGPTQLALLFVVAVIAIMVLSVARRRRRGSAPAGYTYSRGGWTPVAVPPIVWGGGNWGGRGGDDAGGGGGFSPGGGSFGGGGASGDW